MCVFVSRPMKIVTFLRNNDYTPKRVVDFPRERDTFRNKILEIVEDFDEKSYNNNGKPWKSSRILRVKPFFFIFLSFFIIFLHFFVFFSFFSFFIFFHFLSFSIIFFHFLSCSFIFFHFLLFSLIFFHFLSFFFIFFVFVGCSKSVFFLGLNFVTISLDSSYVKNQFWGPSRVVPLWALFSFFFLPFFLLFFVFFSFFLIFCSFLHFFLIF